MENEIFHFKQKSQDFIVEEVLPFKLDWKWDALFVFFEKVNLNTIDVINHLCGKFRISRKTLGIAWLKDKKAVTRQRISIYDSALRRLGWKTKFLDGLSEIVKILKTDRHREPIWLSTKIDNKFYIRLRGKKILSIDEKKLYKETLEKIFIEWFPNLFGVQRFWIEWRNRKQWQDIIEWKKKITEAWEIIFKLQAYSSKIFNEYLIKRIKDWFKLLDWEVVQILDGENSNRLWVYKAKTKKIILISEDKRSKDFFCYPENTNNEVELANNLATPTWAVIWLDTLLNTKWTESEKIEQKVLKKREITSHKLKKFREYRVFGRRRLLRIFPKDVKLTFQKSDLLMTFSLPSWSYASVVIDEMFERIENKKYK